MRRHLNKKPLKSAFDHILFRCLPIRLICFIYHYFIYSTYRAFIQDHCIIHRYVFVLYIVHLYVLFICFEILLEFIDIEYPPYDTAAKDRRKFRLSMVKKWIFHTITNVRYNIHAFSIYISLNLDVEYPPYDTEAKDRRKFRLGLLEKRPMVLETPENMQKNLREMRGPEEVHNELLHKQFGIQVNKELRLNLVAIRLTKGKATKIRLNKINFGIQVPHIHVRKRCRSWTCLSLSWAVPSQMWDRCFAWCCHSFAFLVSLIRACPRPCHQAGLYVGNRFSW